jgi:predicted phosphodiesterase
MKLALISDIHGNTIALDRVLEDIEHLGGVDELWVLGDLAALGPDPVGVLDRLADRPNTRFLRGNTDRYVTHGDRPPPTPQQVLEKPELMSTLLEINRSFAWTQGALTVTGWMDWMKALPVELETRLPDGTRLLGVHASPGTDDGAGFASDDSEQEIIERLKASSADLVCTGHTHDAFDRKVGRWHVVNLGCVSNQPGPDKRACYVILDADENGYKVEHRRIAYDTQAFIAVLEKIDHPGINFIRRFYS